MYNILLAVPTNVVLSIKDFYKLPKVPVTKNFIKL